MRQYFTIFYLRNAIIVLLVLTPLFSWSYHTFYFNDYIARVARRAVEIVETAAVPYHIAKLNSLPRDAQLSMPVAGVLLSQVDNNWGHPRDGGARTHKGIDIFAKRNTPIYAATSGYVTRVGVTGIGGNHVYVIGAGGVRYYYAHLERFGKGIKTGVKVTEDTIIGYVGNTGNAVNTPPHLHFGMYLPNQGANNPYSLLTDRGQSLVAGANEEE